MNKKQLLNVLCLSTVLTIASSFLPKVVNNNIPVNAQPSISSNDNIDKLNPIIPDEVLPEKKEITLSFIGDCTIGGETSTVNSFNDVFKKNNNDFDYFFKGVKSVLENDDLTIANLETTFTKETKKEPKQFNFKGDPSYVNILLRGSVEAVNLANNHTMDYCEKGYEDTIRTLLNANIGYFGKNAFLIKEIKGIKFGFAGFLGWSNDKKTRLQIEEAMKYFDNKKVDIKIVTFHWGEEYHYTFNPVQEALGKYAIDRGANLVIGHHPHILQGIQEYNNSYIVYSLGNFILEEIKILEIKIQ